MDVDALVDESNQELKDYANQRIPLPKRDLDEKDNDLLSKVSMIAQAVKVDELPIFGVDVSPLVFARPLAPSDPLLLCEPDQRGVYDRGPLTSLAADRKTNFG